jgi:hypothetical protein
VLIETKSDPTINLFIRCVEIIQAAQDRCSSGEVTKYVGLPLVGNKRTVVRVHVDVSGAAAPVNGVTAELRGFSGLGTELWGSPLKPNPEKITINPSDDFFKRRADATKTFNFLLPYSWSGVDTITLKATINVGGTISEIPGGDKDNTETVTDVIFNPMESISITAVPVSLGGAQPPKEALEGTFSFLRATYPVSDAIVKPSAQALVLAESNPSCDTVLNDLKKSFTLGKTRRTFIYGVMPYGLDCSGMAWFNSRYAIGHGVLANRGWIAAQEIGHNIGYTHASCDHGEKDGGGCEDWPYPHGGIDTSVGTGFAPGPMLVMPAKGPFATLPTCTLGGTEFCKGQEDHAHDFMSYGPAPIWIASKTWQRFYDTLSALKIEIPPSSSASEYLVVSGTVDVDGKLTIEPFYRVKPSDSSNDEVGSGSYAIQLQGSGGQILFTRRFEPDLYTHQKGGSFVQVLPYPPGTARIVIQRGGATASQTLATVEVSNNTPIVKLVSPNGGEIWAASGTQTIMWRASDADGDTLHYAVQYSTDGGQSWNTIAVDLTEASLAIDSALLVGSDGALIKVLATDGVNTNEDQSDAPFKVTKKAPIVTITAPVDGMVFPAGTPVPLEGSASDLEDGALSGDSLSWSSDKAGTLGTGRKVDTLNLSEGNHVITLTARDQDGQTSRAQIRIIIGAADTGSLQPLNVSSSATARQVCSSNFSHELMVTWKVTGGRPPIQVTIEITGPDGKVETIKDLPLEGERKFQLNYPGGGSVKIKVVAKDASNSSSSAQSSVQLGKCQ